MIKSRPKGSVRYDNRGRVVIVTGGAGGIGREICRAYVDSGAHVVCADVDDSGEILPPEVQCYRCDTSVEADCQRTVAKTFEAFGAVDVLVNNAAIQPSESYRPIDQLATEIWDRMVAINFSGYTFMAKYALRVMREQGSGVIINMSSGQAHRTAREVGVYGPIKSANVMQARQWGIEYARDGIRVVSISPGAIDTPMVRATLQAQGGGAALANRHPVGRIGKPEEVAQAVLWLSSSDASFVTATDLEVDGGLGAFGAFAEPYPMPSNQEREP
ncbi:SDR family NAD(P)-dependent oxidoreductase [Planctomycetaceae bacterium SH139]